MFEAARHAARISRNSAALTGAASALLYRITVISKPRGAIDLIIGKARLHRIAE